MKLDKKSEPGMELYLDPAGFIPDNQVILLMVAVVKSVWTFKQNQGRDAWFHKQMIDPKYVDIRLEMISSTYIHIQLNKSR